MVDGGYYTRTKENVPVIGKIFDGRVEGAYVVGAMSGFGVMGSNAAGELAAKYVVAGSGGKFGTSGPLPAYAAGLSPSRFTRPSYDRVADLLHKRNERFSI